MSVLRHQVLLLLNYFYVPRIVCGSSVFVFALVCITLCPLWFCIHLDEEKRAGCFAFIVFCMSCYYKCCVVLPQDAIGWSAVCECDIS